MKFDGREDGLGPENAEIRRRYAEHLDYTKRILRLVNKKPKKFYLGNV